MNIYLIPLNFQIKHSSGDARLLSPSDLEENGDLVVSFPGISSDPGAHVLARLRWGIYMQIKGYPKHHTGHLPCCFPALVLHTAWSN